MKINNKMLIAIVLVSAFTHAAAQQADVTFFVIGKHVNYRQSSEGARNPVDYSFFSEIFLTEQGDASNATLGFPGGERVDFRDMRRADGGSRDNIFLVTGDERFTRVDGLQSRYPDGRYTVSFESPSGSVSNGELNFRPRPLPAPPAVSVSQGQLGNCELLAPGRDAEVRWQPFTEGRTDPNGILDDLVFVILTDSDGHRVAHSGRPFSGDNYLTFADKLFVIDGEVLVPDSTYTLSVEHALLDDTTRFRSVPAFTTRAATTKLELRTSSDDAHGCTTTRQVPSLDSQVTMFYYDDITDAANFYGNTLGLETTVDWDWVKFYRTGPSSNVGIVQQGDGAYHSPKKSNAVMLSLVTAEVDAWFDRLGHRDDVVLLKPIGSGGGIRSFLLEDPGGYTVEFFQWLDGEE